VIILDHKDPEIREAENEMNRTLDKILVLRKGRSEKLIPLENNVLPKVKGSCKEIEKPLSPQKNVAVRIRNVQRSQTKII
jgi:hypothetical protein